MSGQPKRGMVAGQPIQTGPQTAEFDAGWDRIFGQRKMERGRFVWNSLTNQMEPVGADWTDAERRAPTATEEATYGGMRATDGTDISSRKKHREWKKQNNLADTSDFTQTWAKAEAERAKHYNGEKRDAATRERIAREVYKRFK